MKLQGKFTLFFILLVAITISVSFFVINWSFQSQFNQFIQEKNQQWQHMHISNNMLPLENPFQEIVIEGEQESPEQNYLHTLSRSLLFAGIIDVGFAIILAYFLSSFLLQKIFKLKSSMHQYMEDGVSKPVFHESDDEVDDLANIYNQLIAKIEKEEQVRKDFFIDMSHELRTPLTSIKGYLEGLIDHVFDKDKEKDVHEKALHETDRMIHLVKEMTTLAKLETDQAKIVFKDVDLHSLTEEVQEMFEPQAKEKGLKITVNGKAEVKGDLYKLKQVFINLFDNALQYADPGSAIAIEMEMKNGRSFWRIKNKAEHVRPSDVENFFERFYRGDKSRSYDPKKPHLGIGLNIVKKIIEQHKGRIEARKEEKNIVFEISLQAIKLPTKEKMV